MKNYYIQGNATRAEEIKAAFEAKGIDTTAINVGDEDFIYFSSNGLLYFEEFSNTLLKIFKTHPYYEELELPVKLKFKAGDEIKTGNTIETIAEVDHATRRYYCESGRTISFANQDLWELDTKPHYDISNFYAGMPVLARDSDEQQWLYTIFGIYDKHNSVYPFVVVDMRGYAQCIPFEGNEHLLGTTDMPSEEFINW